jgi:hypothetical protein
VGEVDVAIKYATGINQHQDPGLEPERREAAIFAVKRAMDRDVFSLDKELTEAEFWSVAGRNQHIRLHYAREAEVLMEEMLCREGSHIRGRR